LGKYVYSVSLPLKTSDLRGASEFVPSDDKKHGSFETFCFPTKKEGDGKCKICISVLTDLCRLLCAYII
jgi:hypothetical protein